VTYANQLCNQYGVDSISCGATLSWAMECFEKGLLTTADTDGIELRFGNAEAMIAMLEKTLKREGFGDVLAEGSEKAAARLGRGQEYVLTVKGQELPAHMPHVKRSLGLIYAVNPFGADHQSHEHDPSWKPYPERMAEIGVTGEPQPNKVLNEAKVRFALLTQYAYSCLDSVNVCQFVFGPAWHLYGMGQLAEVVQAVTGWPVTVDELQRVGERRLNLLRAYNAREGIDRAADTLPKKMHKALVGGKSDGLSVTAEELELAKDMYYAMAGWDVATGTPTRARLEELDLAWVADLLEA
jgi:aldehyde:ferredoxin oxidoreductase